MRCWFLLILTALSTIVNGLPTTTTFLEQSTTTTIITNTDLQQPSFDTFPVDVSRYAQLLSTHLLFDHLENAFYMLSKKISLQFRDSIHVNVNFAPHSHGLRQQTDFSLSSSPIDVQILKGQLKGAVGSFIEDKFPAVWSRHAVALDRASLQSYIELVVHKLCAYEEHHSSNDNDETTATVSNVCLETHARQFLSSIDRYLGNHVKRTMADIVSFELPVLFDTTRAQVQDIVKHFNQHVLSEEEDHLELVLEADHTEWWVPSEINEVLETVVHWQTPNNELLQQQQQQVDTSNNNNQHQYNRPKTNPSTMFSAVHHFATLARVSLEQA
ncbi:hypothetical protein BDA99DRAFT_522896 [Phascolomyces articulosus]|uniref:Uncharacterized protein n=1 Tax=Phascolomyces articulosus TaxID=60185 RepID=A0AAD5K293_9FUNG|nr:hypothetical protein BDA99DRAFT_522896 [Phascolomyces articulosus]